MSTEIPPTDGVEVKQIVVPETIGKVLNFIPGPVLSFAAALDGALMNAFKYGVSIIFFVLGLLYLFSWNNLTLDIIAYIVIAIIAVETVIRYFIVQRVRKKMTKMFEAAERINTRSENSSDKDAYVEGSMARLVYNTPQNLNPYSNDEETKQEEWLSGWVDTNLELTGKPTNDINSRTNQKSLD